MHHSTSQSQRGIALLITLLVMTVLLGISSSLINITLKQFQFASIGLASEKAFQAANAGMECALFQDYEGYPVSDFDVSSTSVPVPAEASVACMRATSGDLANTDGNVLSGEEQRFEYSWPPSSPELCTSISIYKFSEVDTYDANTTGPDMSVALGRPGTCAESVVCTVIRARGYNVPCNNRNNPRTIERELTQRY